EKSRLDKSADALRSEGALVEEGLSKLSVDIARLEEKLADAKTRQKALLTRHETASRRLAVRKRIHDYRIDDALVRFEQFEGRMDQLEGRVEAYDLGGRKGLKEKFSDLESADTVEKALEELKARRAARKSQGSEGG